MRYGLYSTVLRCSKCPSEHYQNAPGLWKGCSKGQLHYAVYRDKDLGDVISLLIDRGAPLNAALYHDDRTLVRLFPVSLGTALHIAAEQGKIDAICLLVHLGADTGVKDANGDTVLKWAQK